MGICRSLKSPRYFFYDLRIIFADSMSVNLHCVDLGMRPQMKMAVIKIIDKDSL